MQKKHQGHNFIYCHDSCDKYDLDDVNFGRFDRTILNAYFFVFYIFSRNRFFFIISLCRFMLKAFDHLISTWSLCYPLAWLASERMLIKHLVPLCVLYGRREIGWNLKHGYIRSLKVQIRTIPDQSTFVRLPCILNDFQIYLRSCLFFD